MTTPSALPPTKKKIAILGGGPAGLAVAWELTRQADWDQHYEVTVYQPGWRLGGKCRTGRGPASRIEEHGIHVFMGSYDNVFAMLKDAYAERQRLGYGLASPYATWSDAFEPCNSTVLMQATGPGLVPWTAWPIVLPANDAVPGDGPPPSIWQALRDVVGAGLEAFLGSPYAVGQGPLAEFILSFFFPETDDGSLLAGLRQTVRSAAKGVVPGVISLYDALRGRDDDATSDVLSMARALVASLDGPPEGATDDTPTHHLLAFLEGALQSMQRWSAEAAGVVQRDVAMLEFAVVALRGLLNDVWQPSIRKFDFARIDHLDFRVWLQNNGATPTLLGSSLVRFLYAGTFSNLSDGAGQGGSLAAGTAIWSIIAMLSYKGSLVWQMRAGTGDTFIAPVYQLLAARGVQFRFFQRVARVHDGPGGSIERIDMVEQARVLEPLYRPLTPLKVEGGVLDVWPSAPLWDQLHPADRRASADAVGLEDEDFEPFGRAYTLERGVDFDQVVYAAPVGTLPLTCADLMARLPRWQWTYDNVKTTATEAFQLWLNGSNAELGVPLAKWGIDRPTLTPNIETYAPVYTAWDDATVTLRTESWPDDEQPRAVSYLCGAANDPPIHDEPIATARARATRRVRARAEQWLGDNMGQIFTNATTPEYPFGLDFSRLCLPESDPSATPRDRFEAQFFRANVSPSERYTLSPPGTLRGRLRFDDTGFDNLALAGDWVGHDYINAGFVEGAVFCGIEAARAVRTRLGLANPIPLHVPDDVFMPYALVAPGRA
jgi:uncharacterized protein with NAD-binding domain and iron-sulfur cluster